MYSFFQGSLGTLEDLRKRLPCSSGVTSASSESGYLPALRVAYSSSAVTIAVMSALALPSAAWKNFDITLGTTRVASRPMMTMTTIISARVKPRRARGVWAICMSVESIRAAAARSLAEVADLEDRKDDRDDDIAYDNRQKDDHDRLQDRGHALRGDVDLLVVGQGDAVEHLLELARLLADRDHVADDGREGVGLLEGRGDVGALEDARADVLGGVRD